MIIKSIKFKEHRVPKCSGGTGYSEPDVFTVETDVVTKDISIDIWYRTKDSYRSIFEKAMRNGLEDCYKHFAGQIDIRIRNMDEAYNMYLKALKEK